MNVFLPKVINQVIFHLYAERAPVKAKDNNLTHLDQYHMIAQLITCTIKCTSANVTVS